ncbi:MAG: hypothetical protein O2923_06585 [Verrucomicrobia bacterium]|nr:hypothetical protein [Verrucomicrobiota bacterium]MDA1087628.1 hypothetical protein [Verrucomicrobiota bacterium]
MAPQVETSKRGSEVWFLKTDDGSVYGPVPFDELNTWAAQGRIAPGNQLSSDQSEWIAAESLAELDMVWVIEVAQDSQYGPLNMHALPELVNDGMIQPGMRLMHSGTKETLTVGELLERLAQERAATPRKAKRSRAVQSVTDAEAAIVARVEELEKKAQAAVESRTRALRELETIKKTHGSELEESVKRGEGLETQLKQVQKEYASVAARLKVAEEKVEKSQETKAGTAKRKSSKAKAATDEAKQWERKEVQLLQQIESLHDEFSATRDTLAAEQRAKDLATGQAAEFNRKLGSERKRLQQMEVELSQQLALFDEERKHSEEQALALDAVRKEADDERTRRQSLEDLVVEKQQQVAENEDHVARLAGELEHTRETFERNEDLHNQEIDALRKQYNTLQEEYEGAASRVDEAVREVEKRNLDIEGERVAAEQRMQEGKIQYEQLRTEYGVVCEELDQALQELNEHRGRIEDHQEREKLRAEELERESEHLKQELQSVSMRLEQQRQFYDEEREARRQKEMDLLTEKKKYQDLLTSMRQNEHRLSKQIKMAEEQASRSEQKEQMLQKRLDQVQRGWRPAPPGEGPAPDSTEVAEVGDVGETDEMREGAQEPSAPVRRAPSGYGESQLRIRSTTHPSRDTEERQVEVSTDSIEDESAANPDDVELNEEVDEIDLLESEEMRDAPESEPQPDSDDSGSRPADRRALFKPRPWMLK